MTDEPPGGSPPCLACEMEDAYAGFLPPDELASALARLLLLAERAPDMIKARWRAVLEPAIRGLPAPAGEAVRAPYGDDKTGDLLGEARALLPRIADDRLHAALKALTIS